ncbi:MAG: (d)CMP kinase [Candidatus Omnitrophica bacterium]|nr:(d)CMP kinase [Candidatus Omnitrophota bacterium]MBU0896781.1 (d)CMP kinase [Candidatus Omnitrophota bacterium]MBU1133586.1 (d)CMP kinase [Candidatus Omnitrophota bacterium]MBU1366953.1 (d)CMP kinase [Candidatus Omnitrophota bacterium]MBU1523345.1 (d)CMP kinase [Candidatus Omnitrophota bacterium]
MIIAIDGPAGSGKTSIAKRLAKKLNMFYLDTGGTYRALTLKALEGDLDLKDEVALQAIAKNLNLKIEQDRIYLDGRDVSEKIRAPFIDKNISKIVSYPKVREAMVSLQRRMAESGDFVVEGRDITTVVFPQSKFKFYLDAEFAVRVQRRFKELENKGVQIDFEELTDDLKRRDEADINREVGALKQSPDAVYIDSTNLSLDEAAEKIVGYIRN